MLSHPKGRFLVIIFALILISCTCSALLQPVSASKPNLENKSMAILDNVIGLNMKAYESTQSIQRDTQIFNQPQQEVDMNLVSSDGSLRVKCSYVKDTLQIVYLSDFEGKLSLKKTATKTVDMAKSLLEQYQNYAGAASYNKFASMLDDVKENRDIIKYSGNVRLQINGSDQNRLTYTWTYVDSNGVVAEKKNVILLYEGGMLKGFYNNWPLYDIANTTPKISAKQAVDLAVEASKSYSYVVSDENGVNTTISGLNVSPQSLDQAKLIYVNSKDQDSARGGNPSELYLAWLVPLGLDKFYPGDVSGLTVILWADTGEICSMNRVIVNGIKPEFLPVGETVSQESPLGTLLVVVSVFACTFVLIARKKAKLAVIKHSSPKFWAMLFCVIAATSFIAIPAASADVITARSRVYAMVIGDGYHNPLADAYEVGAAYEVTSYISTASQYAGYISENQAGNPTTRETVIANALSDETNYPDTMLFHCGHQSGVLGYQCFGGVPLYWDDIYPLTSARRHFFTFLWVCRQAEDPTTGMSVGWTHRDGTPSSPYMWPEGFEYPDGSGQCYISFHGYSPMLSNYPWEEDGKTVIYEYSDMGGDLGPCKLFLEKFYEYALYDGWSVRDSLDLASGWYFECPFSSSALHTGYNTWWPGGDFDPPMDYMNDEGWFPMNYQDHFDPDRPLNRMRVFGDSSIKLKLQTLTVNAYDSAYNPVAADVYIDDVYAGTANNNFKVTTGPHTIYVESSSNVFHKFTGYSEFQNPISVEVTSATTITANYYANPPPQYTLSISVTGGGTTLSPYTPGNHQMTPRLVTVTADPNDGYVFDHWVLDTQNIYPPYSDNPTVSIDIPMSANHILQAVFIVPPNNFAASIISYDGLVYEPDSLLGYRNDGQIAGIGAAAPYGVSGEIVARTYYTTLGHIYAYAYGVSAGGPLHVYTSADGYNWNYIGYGSVSSTTPSWVDCGYTLTPFSYIRFRVVDGFSAIAIDSMRVDTAFHTLTPTKSGSGTTNPSSPVQCLNDTYRSVTAQASSGWAFDHWEIDGVPQPGSNPYINVHMLASHTVRAVFVQVPPAYISSVTGTFGAVGYPTYLVGSQPNGQYAGIIGMGAYNVYGWIAGMLNQQTAGQIYVYGYGGSGTLKVYTSTDGSSWTLRGSPTINQGSPGWIYCGTCSTQFRYIKLQTVPSGYYTVYIDCVKVQP